MKRLVPTIYVTNAIFNLVCAGWLATNGVLESAHPERLPWLAPFFAAAIATYWLSDNRAIAVSLVNAVPLFIFLRLTVGPSNQGIYVTYAVPVLLAGFAAFIRKPDPEPTPAEPTADAQPPT